MSVPAGPAPLMPNRLWSLIASALWPQPDSSIAGRRHRNRDAVPALHVIAPGATWLMNAC
jgi:hypothetical protein